jgi:Tol biopolymer transport system component
MLVMKPSVGLSLLCLVICSCGSTGSAQRTSREILVIGGAYDERWSAVEARWSPDGRRIAAIAGDNVSGEVSIVVMNADGHGQRQVVPVWHGYSHLLEWSANGERILHAPVCSLVDAS